MKTLPFPHCTEHKLLRVLTNGSVVVSSAALYDHLGDEAYQKFIAGLHDKRQPNMGFKPESVEAFLDTHRQPAREV